MKGNRDGQKPWSEDELFDLDSALCCGGDIEDIADFLSREAAEVERKAAERRDRGGACHSGPRPRSSVSSYGDGVGNSGMS